MSDKIVQCLHCSIHVQPKQDGTCPSCQANALHEPTAEDVIQIQRRDLMTAKHLLNDAAQRNLLQGAMWFVGGLIVTGRTYARAASHPDGGRYVLALWSYCRRIWSDAGWFRKVCRSVAASKA